MTNLRALSEPRTEAGKRLERKVMADPNARVIDVVAHEDILAIEAEAGSDAEGPALDVERLAKMREAVEAWLDAERLLDTMTVDDGPALQDAWDAVHFSREQLADEYARLDPKPLAAAPGDAEWGEHRYHGIASDPDGIIRCQKDGFTIDPNAELSKRAISAVETTPTPDLIRKAMDDLDPNDDPALNLSLLLTDLRAILAGQPLPRTGGRSDGEPTIPPTAPSGSPPVGLDAERLRAALRNFVDNDTDHFDWEGVARPGHSDPDIARCPGCRSERQRWYDEARAALDVEAAGDAG